MTPIVDPEMRAYYERRAAEYDDWWLGTGLFANRDRPGWDEEVAALVDVIAALPPGRVLDRRLRDWLPDPPSPRRLVALDQSPSMAAIAGTRVPQAEVVTADAVPLPFPDGEFDRVFTSHFYGHLLPEERETFLAEARRASRELVVVDSALRPDQPPEVWQERVLDDGSRHRVYKRYFSASGLAAEVRASRTLFDGAWFVAVAAP